MIVNLASSTIAGIIGYVEDLFTDFLPLTILLIGLFLGFFIIEAIIDVLRKEK